VKEGVRDFVFTFCAIFLKICKNIDPIRSHATTRGLLRELETIQLWSVWSRSVITSCNFKMSLSYDFDRDRDLVGGGQKGVAGL
jgi:hypothetical protein